MRRPDFWMVLLALVAVSIVFVLFLLTMLTPIDALALERRPYGWTTMAAGDPAKARGRCAGLDHHNFGPCPNYQAWTQDASGAQTGGASSSSPGGSSAPTSPSPSVGGHGGHGHPGGHHR